MLFNYAALRLRKQQLKDLEQKRVKFAMDMKAQGVIPDRVLYVQKNGGFTGIGIDKTTLYVLTGPAPDDEAPFGIQAYKNFNAYMEEIYVEEDGLGGMFGFGKKGGNGWRFIVSLPNDQIILEIIPNMTNILDVLAIDNRLFFIKEKQNYNFVFDMIPRSMEECNKILIKWTDILNCVSN
ncbi:MAG: hypothetical protein ACYDG2_08315 [Ruminiclostridium sp.]